MNTKAARWCSMAVVMLLLTAAGAAERTWEPVRVTTVWGVAAEVLLAGESHWQAVQEGMTIGELDVIRTGYRSGCTVEMGEAALVEVRPLSCVEVEKLIENEQEKQARMLVRYGAVRTVYVRDEEEDKEQEEDDPCMVTATPAGEFMIEGTVTWTEYDRGMNYAWVAVLEDGPATMETAETDYPLVEKMYTDSNLQRYLRDAVYEHKSWVRGNYKWGDMTRAEAEDYAHYGSVAYDYNGTLNYDFARSRYQQRTAVPFVVVPGDDIVIDLGSECEECN